MDQIHFVLIANLTTLNILIYNFHFSFYIKSELTFHFDSLTEKAMEQCLKNPFQKHVSSGTYLETAEVTIFLTSLINRLLGNSSRSPKDLY